ncbi:MAG: ureidoglycolate lyase [Xanthobacteraceae bacterium]|nr:ureidoglycolate lyase [Xanthobacteraceae bacterium]
MTEAATHSSRRLHARPLTAQAFAPFGSVATIDGAGGRAVNQNRARRIPGVGDLRHAAAAARPVLDIYRITPSSLPFAVTCFERHVLTSQAFVPLDCGRLLIVVAPDDGDGGPDIERAAAFIGDNGAIIHYRAGAWHSPLVALDRTATLAMLMWEAGDDRDCEEIAPARAIEIVAASA